MPAFDLARTPWVPTTEGPDRGLADLLLNAHRTQMTLSGTEYTALVRVLTVITGRLTGLDSHTDPQEWAEHRARAHARGHLDPDAVAEYFAQRPEGFDLYHPDRPWMQDPRLRTECPKTSGLWKLAWGRGTLDRPGHFWWAPLDLPIPSGQAARDLLTQLFYGAGGKVTARDHNGARASTTGMGPLRASLSVHPHGRTLFEDLLLGMPYIPRTGPDEAPWDAPLNDPLTPLPAPAGLAGAVLGRFRHAILIDPSPDGTTAVDAWVTWGAQAATETAVDPWQINAARPDGTRYTPSANHLRPLWRDLPRLMDPDHGAPAWLRLAQDAPALNVPEDLAAASAGMDQERGQSKDYATIGVVLPGTGAALADEASRDALLERVDRADQALRALGKALASLRKQRGVDGMDVDTLLANTAVSLEKAVLTGTGTDPAEQVLTVWEEQVVPVAGDSFEAMQAETKALGVLERALPRAASTPPTPESAPAAREEATT